MNNFMHKIKALYLLKKGLRYILVLFVFIAAANLSKNEDVIELENKQIQEKKEILQDEAEKKIFQIGEDDSLYKIKNSLHSGLGDYYRMSFETESSDDVRLDIKTLTAGGRELTIGSLDLIKSEDLAKKELFFKTNGNYNDLVFEKIDKTNLAAVYIGNVKIFKLNVQNDAEFKKIQKNITGKKEDVVWKMFKTKDEAVTYANLETEKILLGQTFIAETDFLSGVSFNIEKRGNGGGGKYSIELREVRQQKDKIDIDADAIASFKFSAIDLEKYMKNGTAFFPLFSSLKRGQMYYVGINNNKVNLSSGHLILKGSSGESEFDGGDAFIEKTKKANKVGDLEFALYRPELTVFDNNPILIGSEIIDLGQGAGVYLYETSDQMIDLMNLSKHSGEIGFDEKEKVIFGKAENEAFYEYKINTVYPFENVRIQTAQMYKEWYDVKLYYSFNQQDWEEISSIDMDNEAQQLFDAMILGDGKTIKTLYIKVSYDKFDSKATNLFGIGKLQITADLNMNNK